MGSAEDRCCESCAAPQVKYHSVDAPHNHCGETCLEPSKFKLFKIFEKNLTRSTSNTPCVDLGWPVYDTTVTHGFGPVKATLDLFNHEGENAESEPTHTKSEEVNESAARCCESCTAPQVKYHSVDAPHNHCGETCLEPSKFKLFKIFEKNLTRSTSNTPCVDLGWPVYDTTVTHGFGPVKATLDLFNHEGENAAPAREPGLLSGKCPDLKALRSEKVKAKDFKPETLVGVWYEAAYIDVAQAGAACQRLNFTYNDTSGSLTAPFFAKYGPIPFTIVEDYAPQGESGLYTKTASPFPNGPGKNLIKLPTVVADADDDVLILYSCIDAKITAVQEIIIATRQQLPPDGALNDYKKRARDLGIVFDDKDLKTVDQTKC